LLAATILALHPDPSSNVLLPLMHKNLAQISRTWIAGQLIKEHFDTEAVQNCIQATPVHRPLSTNAPSAPVDLIQWKPVVAQHIQSTNLSRPGKTPSIAQPIEHITRGNSLNPLAPIFLPSQNRDTMQKSTSSLPHSRINNRHLSETKHVTNSAASMQKYVAPALRVKTLLPGQTVLSKFFRSATTSKSTNVPPSLSLPETQNTCNRDQGQSMSQAPTTIPQSTMAVQAPTQRTLFDFQFFQPYATISDSDPNTWGHTPESIDTSTTFRLLFQNPNGIKPTVTDPDFLFSLHLCQEIGVSAICLAETNLNWNHSQHHISLRRCLFRTWKSAKFQTLVPEERFLGNFQPGGYCYYCH